MEKRVLTLELVVEQNTKMVERLDRSMAQLTQAMADLRVEMGKGSAELRREMAADHEKLRNKIATVQADMRQEMIAGFAEERKYGDKKFFWLLSAHFSTFIAIVGLLVKYFIEA